PVAGYMMAKRGLMIEATHFYSYPYTSERALNKVITLGKELTAFCGTIVLSVVPFTEIQEAIREYCPEAYFTLVMRRFMMRISETVAEARGCHCLVTGESLGQVASQTVQALGVTNAVCALPVLRPLIGMDKEEIVRVSRKIETFETSVLPYEDCCTVFTPKRPKTKPRLRDIEVIEAKMDVEGLIQKAIQNIERQDLHYEQNR
ncbi:tRNA 4-thiouridine(8) synthase ThiI, partial [Oscillospiraceae bacterium OttesenSCG-928-F05]|nr:tRNA 4-thiouridine(8) synthase ThiI [Oscillospiraceae bacterium OttesenSCG-928-F05]